MKNRVDNELGAERSLLIGHSLDRWGRLTLIDFLELVDRFAEQYCRHDDGAVDTALSPCTGFRFELAPVLTGRI